MGALVVCAHSFMKAPIYAPIACLALGLIPTAVAGNPTLATIHGQPSYVIRTPQVELAVTRLGGHMAPVTFYRNDARPVQPYHITPWQDERPKSVPVPVLAPLRGDFFCVPFGGNSEALNGEKHPPHGEVAGSKWQVSGSTKTGDVTTLTMTLQTTARSGRVTKRLSLVDGQNVVYSQHVVEGFSGRYPLGHHATLSLPEKEGALRLAASPFRFGMTCPSTFSDPKNREYQSLLPGAKWTDLSRVPVIWKDTPEADLTRQPGRYGFADLVQVVAEPWERTGGPAWMTATHTEAGYVWFSLKDPAVLNSTVIWIENHGRHGHPWNGRNQCIGLEDVTAHFADGLVASTGENVLTRAGVATAVELRPGQPTAVNYIQGVVKVPAGFESVRTLEFGPGEVTFVSVADQRVKASVRHEFLRTGRL